MNSFGFYKSSNTMFSYLSAFVHIKCTLLCKIRTVKRPTLFHCTTSCYRISSRMRISTCRLLINTKCLSNSQPLPRRIAPPSKIINSISIHSLDSIAHILLEIRTSTSLKCVKLVHIFSATTRGASNCDQFSKNHNTTYVGYTHDV